MSSKSGHSKVKLHFISFTKILLRSEKFSLKLFVIGTCLATYECDKSTGENHKKT